MPNPLEKGKISSSIASVNESCVAKYLRESEERKKKLQEAMERAKNPAAKKISKAQGGDIEGSSRMSENIAEVVARERIAWKEVLGVDVEVPQLPINITQEVKDNMDRLGFGLYYIPELYLRTLDDLKSEGEEEFLNGLQRLYPKWKNPEALSDTVPGYKPSVARNLNKKFWELAREGKMEFPELKGAWVAVERVSKPSWGEKYKKTPAMESMGLDDYFSVPVEKADNAIKQEFRPWFSGETGLQVDEKDARMLTAPEWNLLANREGWGQTNTIEWTSTEVRDCQITERVVVGNSDYGGAADSFSLRTSYDDISDIGFRVAVVLGSGTKS